MHQKTPAGIGMVTFASSCIASSDVSPSGFDSNFRIDSLRDVGRPIRAYLAS